MRIKIKFASIVEASDRLRHEILCREMIGADTARVARVRSFVSGRPTFNLLPGWAIARPGLHFAHPGNVDRPTQTRGYFCIMNHKRKSIVLKCYLLHH